jgi:hypothetical protein
MKNSMRLPILSVLTALSCYCNLSAQDRFLPYTSPSNVLPKGTREIEIWYANKSGGYAYFNGNYMRTGFKMGFGNNFLLGYYLNYDAEAFVHNEISPIDKKTRLFDPFLTRENTISFSVNGKLKLLDPVANPIGLAIEAEATLGSDFHILAPKLIIDKRFGNEYIAFNVWAAMRKTYYIDPTSDRPTTVAPKISTFSEPPIEFNLAYMHFSKNGNVGIGVETRTHTETTTFAGFEHAVVFAGPALHLRGDKWFFNLSALPQIGNFHKSWIAPDRKVLDEHQNFELRTMLGFMF